jgi:hypothetical protein
MLSQITDRDHQPMLRDGTIVSHQRSLLVSACKNLAVSSFSVTLPSITPSLEINSIFSIMTSITPPLFDLLTSTASELQAQLTDGSLTSVQIVNDYLAQIEKCNHAGVNLNAMITIAPSDLTRKWAGELDQERAEGKVRGPLRGLPVIVKVRK